MPRDQAVVLAELNIELAREELDINKIVELGLEMGWPATLMSKQQPHGSAEHNHGSREVLEVLEAIRDHPETLDFDHCQQLVVTEEDEYTTPLGSWVNAAKTIAGVTA